MSKTYNPQYEAVKVKARSIQSIDQIAHMIVRKLAPYAIEKCQAIDMTDVLDYKFRGITDSI